MARGKSGRIVLEIDPTLKRQLYLTLEKNQMTLKEWFLIASQEFISNSEQMKLFVAESIPEYGGKSKK